jgi:hypothetical protein
VIAASRHQINLTVRFRNRMTICTTNELRKIRPWDKSVFNRQLRPNHYLVLAQEPWQ